MKEKTARELYGVIENACTLMGKATKIEASPDDLMRKGVSLLQKAPPNLKKATAKGGAMGFLRAMPEPTEEEKEQLKSFFGELPFTLRKAFIRAGKDLPYRHGKRTPEKLDTPQKKKDACEDVARLLSLGIEKPDTLRQIGKKYGASDRTIRRIWDEYCKALKSAKPSGN